MGKSEIELRAWLGNVLFDARTAFCLDEARALEADIDSATVATLQYPAIENGT
jgi:hypothetical protein